MDDEAPPLAPPQRVPSPAIPGPPAGRLIPSLYFSALLSAAQQEAGVYSLETLMEQAGIQELYPGNRGRARTARATDLARLLFAFRHYYGQGGRGLLNRIGRATWQHLVERLSWRERLGAALRRPAGKDAQRKYALRLLARFLGDPGGQISVHVMDHGLIVVDRIADTAQEQREEEPVCWNMIGLLQACMFWATGREHDVEEIACRAAGAEACKYRMRIH